MLDHTSSAINFNFFVLSFWLMVIHMVTSSLVVMDITVLSLVEVEMILVVSINNLKVYHILFYKMSPSNSNNSSM